MHHVHAMAPIAHLEGARPPAPAWFEQALAHAPERTEVTVAGAQIETLAWGERGRPGLLLAHGNGASADWWAFIAPLFARDYRVVAPSWSGMGRSGWRGQYGIDLYVQEALEVAQVSGLFDAPVAPVFVGHSFGSVPVLACAARVGDRLRAAVIVDAPLFTRERREARRAKRGPPREPRANRVYPTLDYALTRFRFMPPQTCANLYIADYIARHALKEVPAGDGHDAGWTWRFDPFLWRGYQGSNPGADLQAARCPVALMRGSRSGLADDDSYAYARSLAPAGSPSVEIPDADHHVMVDQPLAFAAALQGLLAGWPRCHVRRVNRP